MNIILAIYSRNDTILRIEHNLKSLNYNVETFYTDAYDEICSYSQHKLYKLGFTQRASEYYEEWRKKFFKTIENFKSDLILFVNVPDTVLTPYHLEEITKMAPTVCWCVDGIKDKKSLFSYLGEFSKIYTFEEYDLITLKENGISANYAPVGYSDVFDNVLLRDKEWDISFLGSAYPNRLRILEKLSKVANNKNWKLKIIGPFYNNKYPWKKFVFSKKYPNICKFLENKTIPPKEAAELYAKSKICLNIHDEKSKSPNPRCFELMASGAFQIIDYRKYMGNLVDGKDLVVYNSDDELIEKINYYLINDEERKRIANNGKNKIYSRFSMRNILENMIKSNLEKPI